MHEIIDVLSTTNETLGETLVAIGNPESGAVRVIALGGLFPAEIVFGPSAARYHWARGWGLNDKLLRLSSTQVSALTPASPFKGSGDVMDTRRMIDLSRACADEARRLVAKATPAPQTDAVVEDISTAPDGTPRDLPEDISEASSDLVAESQVPAQDTVEDRMSKAIQARNHAVDWVSQKMGRLLPRVEVDSETDTALRFPNDEVGLSDHADHVADEVDQPLDVSHQAGTPDGKDLLGAGATREVDAADPMDDLEQWADSLYDKGSVASLSPSSLTEIVATHARWVTAVTKGETVLGLKEWSGRTS